MLTYDGMRMRVGATSDAELESIIARGRTARRDLRGAEVDSRSIRGLIRAKFPRIPRRVSGYNLDELLPENGFHVARALVGSESTCVLVLEAKTKLGAQPAGARAARASAIPTRVRSRRRRARAFSRSSRSAWKDSTTCSCAISDSRR